MTCSRAFPGTIAWKSRTANFLFARTDRMGGRELYQKLREKGILVRHFDRDRIRDYIRITIGSEEQMDIVMDKIKEILD